MSDIANVLVLDLDLTLEDHVAFGVRRNAFPPLSTMRSRREMVTLALAPVAGLLGFLIAWISVAPRWSLRRLARDLFIDHVGETAVFFALCFAVMASAVLINRLLTARRIRRLARAVLLARPRTDPSDPALRQAVKLTLSDEGVSVETTSGSGRSSWGVFDRFDETPDHFFIMSGLGGHTIPKRQLRVEESEALRTLASNIP